MSAWRRKALETFPDMRDTVDAPETTLYTLFFELLAQCQNSDEHTPAESLARIFAFAEWCHRLGGDLQNAADLAFYEHCGEGESVRDLFVTHVPHDVYRAVRPLIAVRIDARHVVRLDEAFARKEKRKSR